MKNRKALSPVVASIILIAVTVAVSIGVAWWMGMLDFSFNENPAPIEKIHFNNDFSQREGSFHVRNISVLLALVPYQQSAVAYVTVQNFDDFLDACRLNNVSCVITDYKIVEIPAIYHANTTYVVEQYSFWFLAEPFPHVGKVAVVCQLDYEAYWLGD